MQRRHPTLPLGIVPLSLLFSIGSLGIGCHFDASTIAPQPDDESNANAYECQCDCTNPGRAVTRVPTQSRDDAEEDLGNGSVQTRGNVLQIPEDLPGGPSQLVGVRFPALGIPQGASIVSAQIQFTAERFDDVATQISIVAEASHDSQAFSEVDFNITARPTTAANVVWTPVTWVSAGDNGAEQLTPDLSAIANELVALADWEPNSPMTFLFGGTGLRSAVSFDNDPAQAAVLIIEYAEPGISASLSTCMPNSLNPNLPGNSVPTPAELSSDCENRVENTLQGLSAACSYPANCQCEAVPDSSRYGGLECDETCDEEALAADCSNFDHDTGTATATNATGDTPVCTTSSPLAAVLYGHRSSCLVSGQATVAIDGSSTKTPAVDGIVEVDGHLCPGGGCDVGLTTRLDLEPITYSNFFGSATFNELKAQAKSLPGETATVGPTGLGVFGLSDIGVAGRGARGSDALAMVGVNDDVINLTIDVTSSAPTCSLEGALLGTTTPELSRCEDAGPDASLICTDDAECTDDAACSDEICNCLELADASTSLAVNVSGPLVNQPPTASAGPAQVIECNMPGAAAFALDGSASSDPDNNFASFRWTLQSRSGPVLGFQPTIETSQAEGTTSAYVLRVLDTFGQGHEDDTTVSIEDSTAPVLHCNNAETLWEPNGTVSFTASAEDICDGNPSVEVVGYTCTKTDKKGNVTDKSNACHVVLSGDTITISRSSGAKTVITWTVRSVDAAGNDATTTCGIRVSQG